MKNNEWISYKQKTGDAIKKAFLSLYKTTPLNKIKVNDLTSASGVSRGTFYFYYEDVYDLYQKCEYDVVKFLEQGLLDIILSTVGSDFDRYVELVSKDLERYIEYKECLNIFLEGSESQRFIMAWYDSVCRNYGKSMEFAQKSSKEKQQALIRFFSAGHLALLIAWIKSGCNVPAKEIASVSAQALFKGVFIQTNSNE